MPAAPNAAQALYPGGPSSMLGNSYDSEEEASQRYDKMHSYMEKDTAKYLAGRNQ